MIEKRIEIPALFSYPFYGIQDVTLVEQFCYGLGVKPLWVKLGGEDLVLSYEGNLGLNVTTQFWVDILRGQHKDAKFTRQILKKK